MVAFHYQVFDQLYQELLLKIMEADAIDVNKELVAFYPMKGRSYDHRLMIVGRALNGWKTVLNRSGTPTADIPDLFEKIKRNGQEIMVLDEQLDWVMKSWVSRQGYSTKQSAFWRVVQKLVHKVYGKEVLDWNHRIVWSNIYKISKRKGNPGKRLQSVLKEKSREMLLEEIRQLKPEVVIFLCGYKWVLKLFEPTALIALEHQHSKQYVEFVGALKVPELSCKIVVAQHPQGKKESMLVDEIMESYSVHSSSKY